MQIGRGNNVDMIIDSVNRYNSSPHLLRMFMNTKVPSCHFICNSNLVLFIEVE